MKTEIVAPNLRIELEQLAREVFGLNLREHEAATQREIVGVLLKASDTEDVTVPIHLFGPCTPELLNAIINKGIVNAKAGWRVDAGPVLGVVPSVDLVLVSEDLMRGPRSEYLGILTHELCHLIIETPLAWLEPEEDAKQAAPCIRRHTKYAPGGPYDGDSYHTDQWFAVLFEATYRLCRAFPDLYSSHEAATEDALCYDRFDEPFAGVTWRV